MQVGYRGLFKVGLWTPVTVTLKGGKTATTGHLRLIVPDGDGLPSRVTSSKPYLVTPGATVSAMLYAKFGRIESDLEVQFVDLASGKSLRPPQVRQPPRPRGRGLRWAMFSGQELIVSLGSSIGVEDAIRLERAMPGKPLNMSCWKAWSSFRRSGKGTKA